MKYMGSKRQLLENGLGRMLLARASQARRVVDLFSGSAAVSWFVAEQTNAPVLSVDLQSFSAILAGAVIERTKTLDANQVAKEWIVKARLNQWNFEFCYEAFALDHSCLEIEELSRQARKLCKKSAKPIAAAYGGHYYSPAQAIALDSMRENLPLEEPGKSICLAALIAAASKCAAAPGHTAQPFSPSTTSERSIKEAWKKDPFVLAFKEVVDICGRAANKVGCAMVANALDVAATLNRHDLVFVDPPYSGVQYSRFYHVLETLTTWKTVEVSGTGRYPPRGQRPQSAFSNKGESVGAVRKLLEALASSKATVLFTFPNADCSNGLSAEIIQDIASENFTVKSKAIAGRFSTLGGNNSVRKARLKSEELILTLTPRNISRKPIVQRVM
jgi:adenine-specific DNA-methyltransferase